MQTLPILTAYFILSLICYNLLDWDYRTRISKKEEFKPENFRHLRVILISSILPGINTWLAGMVIITRYKMWKIKRNRKKLAKSLRESGDKHGERGNENIKRNFYTIADQIENLE